MKISFVRIYGNGIIAYHDLPESLSDRGADIQEWVDDHYSKIPLGRIGCLRIDYSPQGVVLHLMQSIVSGELK